MNSAAHFRDRCSSACAATLTPSRVIDIFYQLNEIFNLLQHDAVRRLRALQNSRRVGDGESSVCSL
jgi:hypothetical protein